MVVFPGEFKDNYLKELLLAVILFCLPALILAHKFFQEDIASELVFFGLTFKNTLYDDQVMAYIFLLSLIPFMYMVFFFFHAKGIMRLTLLLPILWTVYDQSLSIFYMMEPINAYGKTLSFCLALIALYFLLKSFVPNLLTFKKLINLKRASKNLSSLVPIGIFCLLYCYNLIPDDLNVFFIGDIKIDSFLYRSFQVLFYLLGIKLSMLLLLLTWYFTEKKWWKYALLSPILITIYQLSTFFNTETDILDEYEIIRGFPFLVLIAVLLVALSKNAKDQYVVQSVYRKTSSQIEKLLEQRNQEHVNAILDTKRRLTDLKEQKATAHINDLMEIKKQLEHELGERT
ncbi:hypothetical protein MTsPCn5_06950 [Croceitalea sp. MTPC5]|uniref:hypothetical protein n=1 Tax=Croceitalea sp. MTPC5 TaxID=3056565 RepID=UPI002B3CF30B|nr:hypothetical protein MTsPCn5_06950 [Croceitalea sp. MTPC5]